MGRLPPRVPASGEECREADRPGTRRAGLRSPRPAPGLWLLVLLAVVGTLTCDWIPGLGNDAPSVSAAIPGQTVDVGETVVLDLASHFADPDGDPLDYEAVAASPSTATASVSGGALAIAGLAAGRTTVTVAANDPDGLRAEQDFAVTVPNRTPEVADTMVDREVHVDDTLAVDVAAYFADPDGDDLAYSATSSDPGRAAVAVSGSALALTGMAVGGATVEVVARDPGGLTARQAFAVEVPNRTPVVADAIADQVVEVDSVLALELGSYFADPDRDLLAYTASSSDPALAGVAVSSDTLQVTGAAKGSVTVTVTAEDPWGLEAGQSFVVKVPNRGPVAVDEIAGREVFVGDEVEVDVSVHFADPDGDELAYSASSSDPALAEAAVSGATVTLAGAGVGEATVTVVAGDTEGLEAEQVFVVTVPNRAPEAVGAISDREVYVGESFEVDVAPFFAEPDGQRLVYAAAASDTGTAAVAVAGGTVTVSGSAVGSTAVTVTAEDPGGLSAEQRFAVTVPNRAPRTASAIADREVQVDSVSAVDVAAFFLEPDGEALVYSAVSSDPLRAAVALSGSTLTVTGVAKGGVTVTVTASDPWGLEAGQSFAVTVPNRGPVAVGAVADREVFVGDEVEVDVSAHFADPDGDRLVYTASSSHPALATAAVSGAKVTLAGAGVGEAAVTVTASDPEGLSVEQTFAVTVPNRAPEPLGTISDREVYVGESFEVDVAPFFAEPDGQRLVYSAAASDAGTAAVAVAGGTVTVSGSAVGSATVTVTAEDPGGLSAEQRFAVTVPNRAPRTAGTITDREVQVDSVSVVDVAAFFLEPDGETLDYSAVSSDASRAAVSLSGSTLSVTGVAKGGVTVTVTASDPWGLEAGQGFAVKVPNRGPVAVDAIAGRQVFVADEVEVDVSAHFADPDGDRLVYTASSSHPALVTAAVSGTMVTLAGAGVGEAAVTVAATDLEGLSAEQVFVVTVPNRAPEPVGAIADREVFVDDEVEVDVSPYFAEPDGQRLVYAAAVSDAGTAAVAVAGGTVTVSGSAVGSTTVTVTAEDPGGLSAEQGFAVTVPNRAPRKVGTIADRVVEMDGASTVDVAAFFLEPDGETLEYSAVSSDASLAAVAVSGDTLTVTGVARGEATVTVTARDPGGLEAGQSFAVTIVGRAPVAVGTIADREVFVADEVEVDVSPYFADPDGDELAYSASSWDPALATAAVSGTTVTLAGEGVGEATVTVTATDPEGLSAEQVFVVTVPNRAPEALGRVADREMHVGDEVEVDVSPYFAEPDGQQMVYAAVSDAGTAAVAVAGGTVAVSGSAVGSATVTVTAEDPGGLTAEQRFVVTVPNRSPEPVDAIADREVQVGSVSAVDVAAFFLEPDGEALVYSAVSSDASRAAVALSGSTLSVTGVAKGGVTVTVTARDPGDLSATQSFEVTVEALPDLVVASVSASRDTVAPGENFTLDVEVLNQGGGGASSGTTRRYHSSPDTTIDAGDEEVGKDSVPRLDRSARNRQSHDVEAPASAGTYRYGACVDAVANESDGDNNCSDAVTVVVRSANRAPLARGTMPDRTLTEGDGESIRLVSYFHDPDGDDLTYTAVSSDRGVVKVAVSGGTVEITAGDAGEATVTVTATDPGDLSATQSFEVTVELPSDLVVNAASAKDTVAADEHFNLFAYVLNQGAGRASSGTTLRFLHSSDATIDTGDKELGTGTVPQLDASKRSSHARSVAAPSDAGTYYYGACVDAVANESDGDNNCSDAVTVVVRSANRAPLARGTMPDRTLTEGDGESIRLVSYFHDPDGDDLTYTAVSSDRGVVKVAVSGGTVEITAGDAGEATVTVTATDPGDLSATQSFKVTVELPSDLVVDSASANDTVAAGELFRLSVQVLNQGEGGAPSGTTLRYLHSSDSTIDTGDKELGTGAVPQLDASGRSYHARSVAAPSDAGTYYYGACVDSVANESDEGNNCSAAVTVVVRANRAPQAVGSVSDRTLTEGDGDSVDVEPNFADPDGDDLTYTAVSSDTGVVTVAVSGGNVEITAGDAGEATVTVTATDPGDLSATQSFEVRVELPSDLVVNAASAKDTVAADEHFSLFAYVLNQGAGRASSGTTLRFLHSSDATIDTGDKELGTGTVPQLDASKRSSHARSVAAPSDAGTYYYGACVDSVANESDEGNNCSAAVEVVVRANRAPQAVGSVSDRTLTEGDGDSVDVEPNFADPDGDDLTYAAVSSDTGVVTVAVSGSSVEITAEGDGEATVTVTATDPGDLSATQSFKVTVEPPSDLVADSAWASTDTVVADQYFRLLVEVLNQGAGRASSGTAVRYLQSSDTTIDTGDKELATTTTHQLDASERVQHSRGIAAPSDAGTYYYGACVDSVANESDGDNNCSAAVTVVVRINRAPRVKRSLPDRTLTEGDEETIGQGPYFYDPDGDELTYTAVSSDTDVVTVAVSGSNVEITAEADGEATITVTATDPWDLSVSQSFDVTVEEDDG